MRDEVQDCAQIKKARCTKAGAMVFCLCNTQIAFSLQTTSSPHIFVYNNTSTSISPYVEHPNRLWHYCFQQLTNVLIMVSNSSINSLVLDLPPSCIAFCPTQPDLFAVGTYYLHPREGSQNKNGISVREEAEDIQTSITSAPQKRSGNVILFRLENDGVTV